MSRDVNRYPRLSLLAAACALSAVVSANEEQSVQTETPVEQGYQTEVTTETVSTGTDVSIGRSANVESKLSAEFADFLGGEENAAGVVESLRTGQGFGWETGGQQASGNSGEMVVTDDAAATSSSLPTGTMGYGNVRLTLKLAEAQLQQLGVTQPTGEELSAVLLGGEVNGVSLDGILNERAAGGGWGEIAQRYGFKVGDLMGNGKRPVDAGVPDDGQVENADTSGAVETIEGGAAVQTRVARGNGKAVGPGRAASAHDTAKVDPPGKATGGSQRLANGYIPSGGARSGAPAKGYIPSGARQSGARANGYIAGGGHGKGGGIVTAGGGGVAAGAASNGQAKGHVKAAGAGVASTGGGLVSAGNAGAVTAAGNAGGHGLAKGHAKGRP